MKKTFIFYSDWIDYTEEMTMEEKGLFLQTILLYQQGKDIGNIDSIKFVRSRVKKQLDETNTKREEEKKKRSEAGKLGGEASAGSRKQKKAKGSKRKQLQADNVNVNVNDNVLVNDISTNVDNISNDFFEEVWKSFPHARGGKKQEAKENYKRNGITEEELMDQLKLLNMKIKVGLQDIQYVPAMQRWIRDVVPLNPAILDSSLKDIMTKIDQNNTDTRKEWVEMFKLCYGEGQAKKYRDIVHPKKKIVLEFTDDNGKKTIY